jgi:two-component system sensor histidine kinase AlgZ
MTAAGEDSLQVNDVNNNTHEEFFLPDFCRFRPVLIIVVVGELLAIVLTLASADLNHGWNTLIKCSLFVQWTVLLSALCLCGLRSRFVAHGNRRAAIMSYIVLVAVTLVVSEASYWLFRYLGDPQRSSSAWHLDFLLRNFTMSVIISAILLRYLYVQHQWKQQIEAESSARIEALQARIRPHFLFNSMNVIASLTRTRPQQAEEAIEDLAELFRASLAESRHAITLADEIDIAKRYLHIEKLRLGDRLQVDWQLDGVPLDAAVPALLLQPLLENAIYHGIEPRQDGGCITIGGEFDSRTIHIRIGNPVPGNTEKAHLDGNRMAMDNIRQRLAAFYDKPGSLSTEVSMDRFEVNLTFPYIERRE